MKIAFPSLNIKHYYIGKGNSEAFSFAIITDSHLGRHFDDYGSTGWKYDQQPNFDYGSHIKCLRREVNWINEHKEQLNIRFVMHLGDLTDSGEWSEFAKGKEILDALDIPYIPIMGNHDVWPYTSSGEAEKDWIIKFFQETFNEQFSFLSKILANWKKQEWPGDNKNENYYFDYMHFHFICQDYNSRNAALGGNLGAKGEADLHMTGDWMLNHLDNYWNMGDDNILLFAHHPLTSSDLGTFLNFSFAEFDKIRCGLKPKRDHVYRWFAGHIHATDSWPVRDFWHTMRILDVETTSMGYYQKVGNWYGSKGNIVRIIHVKDDLYVDFDYTPLEPTTADVITLTNQTTYPQGLHWLRWDMGDGTIYQIDDPFNQREIVHQYELPNTYKVTLTAKGWGYNPPGSKGAISKSIHVREAPPQIVVNSPKLDDEWEVESIHNITWEATDDVTTNPYDILITTIDYSIDDGNTWVVPPIFQGEINNTGIYQNWQIPLIVSDNCRIRVCAKDQSALEGEGVSDKFRIVWCLMPTDLEVTLDNYDQVTLSWTDNSARNNGYDIAIKKEDEDWEEYAHVQNSPNLQIYSVSGIENDVNYKFRVVAFDENGHLSDSSNVVDVYLEGIQDFTATPLENAVFLEL
jgi:hypothetical protein